MNRRRTMITSIAAVTAVGSVLLLSGFLNNAIAFNPNGAPDYTVAPFALDAFEATKIIVYIDTPIGQETLTSFRHIQTDNLMRESGYYTIRLTGPIMDDKVVLYAWVTQDIGSLPDGLAQDGTLRPGGGYSAKMTKPAAGATIENIPLMGKLKIQLLRSAEDMFSIHPTRELNFSACHIAGYSIGTIYDDEKAHMREGWEYYEDVTFACTTISQLSSSMTDNRGMLVDNLVNAKKEINGGETQTFMNINSERAGKIVTTVERDQARYGVGNTATFTVTFTDLEGNPIDPDTIKAYYDSNIVQLERQDVGLYSYTTASLSKSHHQMIVSAEKTGFATDTSYVSIPVEQLD